MANHSSIENRLELPDRYRPERVLGRPMLEAGERRVIAELEGPGCIRRIFCTSPAPNRNFILRVYWDGEDTPSVEAPVDDFFGIHHDVSYYPINSQYISVKDRRGLACYFPMPFGRSARVEIEAKSREVFIYIVDWQRYLTDKLNEDMRFHASWRRENPAPAWGEDFFVMDAVGRGYLLGYSLGVRLRTGDQRWSHAGSENLYVDGETTGEDGTVPYYLRGAGGEDSFDVGFGGVLHTPDSHLYAGMPYYEHRDTGRALARHVLSAYRFYVNDLVPFEKSLHFRWGSQANDMCMTAYWYQTEPHRPFIKTASFADIEYGDWTNEVEVERGRYDLLKQVAAEGPRAVSAGADDGTWWLYDGDQALNSAASGLTPGIPRSAFHGFIDFSHVFNVRSTDVNVTWPANATAMTKLTTDRDTTATLHLSWDDTMKIRLNDGEVQDLGDHPTYRYRAVLVDLRKGTNTLIVNLDNPAAGLTWGAWTFSCRVTLPDGTVVVPNATE